MTGTGALLFAVFGSLMCLPQIDRDTRRVAISHVRPTRVSRHGTRRIHGGGFLPCTAPPALSCFPTTPPPVPADLRTRPASLGCRSSRGLGGHLLSSGAPTRRLCAFTTNVTRLTYCSIGSARLAYDSGSSSADSLGVRLPLRSVSACTAAPRYSSAALLILRHRNAQGIDPADLLT
jgi:hypothetical protein